MTELTHDLTIDQTAALLTRYGFEMRGYTAQELIERWLQTYQRLWVRLAVVEALYQGRYKAISVEHILNLWFRRGNPIFHFTHEFERLICYNLPQYFTAASDSSQNSLGEYDPVPTNNREKSITASRANPSLWENGIESSLTPWNWQPIPDDETSFQPQNEARVDFGASSPSPAEVEATTREDNTPLPAPDEASLWRGNTSHRSIHQFTPLADGTEFYSKLKAVAQNGIEEENFSSER